MERRRSDFDRRSGSDNRKTFLFGRITKGRDERRSGKERRSRAEARQEWVRIDKWSSVRLESLKIAKFLH
jgi:hypothetical protein